MAKAEANELAPVPLDPFDDEAIKHFSRQKLIDLANSDNATAARQAASELLERTEPKGVRSKSGFRTSNSGGRMTSTMRFSLASTAISVAEERSHNIAREWHELRQ